MEEKKKSSGGLILLVIILMAACLVGGYFLSAKNVINIGKANEVKSGKTSNNKKSEECSSDITVLETSSKELKELLLKTTIAHDYYCGFYKMYVGSKVTPNDLDKEDVKRMMLTHLLHTKGETKEGDTFTKQEVEEVSKKLFGKDFEFPHGDINTCPQYTYDSSKGIYTEGVHACGGTCGPSNRYSIVKAIKTDKDIELYVRMIFIGEYPDTNYYSDYTLTRKAGFNAEDTTKMYFDHDDAISQGSLYKVVFTKEDDYYYITSVEPVN